MTTPETPGNALRAAPFADAEAREARHRVLEELLAPYADGELPVETMSQIEAHLVGCARCRGALDVQMLVGARLAAEPVAPAAALRSRVAAAIRTLPPPAARVPAAGARAPEAPVPQVPPPQLPAARVPALALSRRVLLWLAATGWAAALLGGTLLLLTRAGAAPQPVAGAVASGAVPADLARVTEAAAADFRRVKAIELPGRARDLSAVRATLPFPVEPLASPELRLLGAWTTSLAGEPAAALAYRWRDRVLVQYVVSGWLVAGDPGTRVVAARSGQPGVVAWTESPAGSLLVGDAAPAELSAARTGGAPR